MRSTYSSVDPNTGNIAWNGPLSVTKSDRSNTPARTDAYLPGEKEVGSYDRGHINALSLNGSNTKENIAPMHADVNRAGGGWYAVEKGERTALQNGATIDSTKTAFVNSQPDDRPSAFLVTDKVTYADGHTENIHNSFANSSYTEQQAWNDQSAALPGVFDAPNPEDGLRDSMTAEEYADLMKATDAELPGIADDYTAADFSGLPSTDSDVYASDDAAPDTSSADAATDAGVSSGADCSLDDY